MKDRRRRERAEAKRRTRQALLDAGLDEIIERGIDAGLDGMCARAGYTRGAFYVHFKSREEFLVALTQWIIGDILDSFLGPASEGEDLVVSVARFINALESGEWPLSPKVRTAAIRLMDAIARWPAIRECFDALITGAMGRIMRAVDNGQKSGQLRKDVDAEALAVMVITLTIGAIMMNNSGVAIDHGKQRILLLTVMSNGAGG